MCWSLLPNKHNNTNNTNNTTLSISCQQHWSVSCPSIHLAKQTTSNLPACNTSPYICIQRRTRARPWTCERASERATELIDESSAHYGNYQKFSFALFCKLTTQLPLVCVVLSWAVWSFLCFSFHLLHPRALTRNHTSTTHARTLRTHIHTHNSSFGHSLNRYPLCRPTQRLSSALDIFCCSSQLTAQAGSEEGRKEGVRRTMRT